MEHVSNMILLGFMISVSGMLVVVCVMVSPTCSDCDPEQAFAVDDCQFPTYFPISCQW